MIRLLLLLLVKVVLGVVVENNGLLYEDEEDITIKAMYQDFSFPLPTISPTSIPSQVSLSSRSIIKQGVDDGSIRICYNSKNKTAKKSKVPVEKGMKMNMQKL